MAALSKHRGGEGDRERPECVHSLAIQTDLKPTATAAFSLQLRSSLIYHFSPPIYSIVHLPHFPISSSNPTPSVFYVHSTALALGPWGEKHISKFKSRRVFVPWCLLCAERIYIMT